MKRVLVVAPHPDDEVLGVGGTIRRLSSEKAEITVAIVTKGRPPLFDEAVIAQGRAEAEAAHAALGVARSAFLDFPAAGLDEVPHRELNRALSELVREVAPDTVFLPFPGDIHRDHQLVFQSAMVALRPNHAGAHPSILAYETLSETNWNAPYLSAGFAPNTFVDISDVLEAKLDALRLFASQLRAFPNERSPEAVRALAIARGASVGRRAAEAFVLVRQVL